MTRDASETLEPFRKYLTVLADLHLWSSRLCCGRIRPWARLRDPRPEVLVAWLRRILARTLADAVKHYERDKRDVDLERSLEADLDRSASGFAAWLADDLDRWLRGEPILRGPSSSSAMISWAAISRQASRVVLGAPAARRESATGPSNTFSSGKVKRRRWISARSVIRFRRVGSTGPYQPPSAR